MPRLDRFVDPVHRGIDRVKHMMEDTYDYGAPQQRSGISSWFSGSSRSQPSTLGRMAGSNIGKRMADTFTGGRSGYGSGYGYGQHGYGYDDESIFTKAINFIEHNIFGSTLGPLAFVAYPLALGLFVSAWAHKQVRNNRAWYDKISLPRNIPPAWLYDPTWTLALTAMGYASWLFFENNGSWLTLGLYGFTVMTLFTWPVLFFTLHDSIIAPLVATLASVLMLTTDILFFVDDTMAGLLFLPATAWVMYMTIINWQVYTSNAGLSRVGSTAGVKEKGDWPWSSTATSGVGSVATPVEAQAKKVR